MPTESVYKSGRRTGRWPNGASRFDAVCRHNHTTPNGAQRCADKQTEMRRKLGKSEEWIVTTETAWRANWEADCAQAGAL